MTPILRSRSIDDRLMLWFACVLALGAGFFIAFIQLGTAIDRQHDLTAAVAENMRANDAIIAGSPQLERAAQAVDDSLRGVDLRADQATSIARLIRTATRLATLHHASVIQIDASRSDSRDSPTLRSTIAEHEFETIPLEMTLAGSYRDLLATISDLAQSPVAMRIEIAALERGTTTPLTARLNISLLRLASPTVAPILAPAPTIATPEETRHARSL